MHDTSTLAGALAAAGCPHRIDRGTGYLIAPATHASLAVLRQFPAEAARTMPAVSLEGTPEAPRIVNSYAVRNYAVPDTSAAPMAVEVRVE